MQASDYIRINLKTKTIIVTLICTGILDDIGTGRAEFFLMKILKLTGDLKKYQGCQIGLGTHTRMKI